MEPMKQREPYLNKKEVLPDICVCCGRPVPEGRMICWSCENEFYEDKAAIKKNGKVEDCE